MAKVTRVKDVPKACPRCNTMDRWNPYYLIKEAPAAACGNCGHVVYLTKMPAKWERRGIRNLTEYE